MAAPFLLIAAVWRECGVHVGTLSRLCNRSSRHLPTSEQHGLDTHLRISPSLSQSVNGGSHGVRQQQKTADPATHTANHHADQATPTANHPADPATHTANHHADPATHTANHHAHPPTHTAKQ